MVTDPKWRVNYEQEWSKSLLQVGERMKSKNKVRLLVSTNAGTHNESGGKTICCINLLFCPPLSAARTQGMVTLSPTPFFPPKLWFPIRFLLIWTDRNRKGGEDGSKEDGMSVGEKKAATKSKTKKGKKQESMWKCSKQFKCWCTNNKN